MQKITSNDFIEAIHALLKSDKTIKAITYFCSPLNKVTHRVRASRVANNPETIIISFGHLNYKERKWIKTCKKAKCNPRRVWLQPWPAKKK